MEKETLNLLFGGAIAIGATIVTGLMGEFKACTDARRNRRRILRSALFRQLELYGEVIRLSPDAHKALLDGFTNMFKEVGIPSESIDSFQVLGPHLGFMMKTMLSPDIKALGARYEEIVSTVAEVDPLLAETISQRFEVSRMDMIDRLMTPSQSASIQDLGPVYGLGQEMLRFHHKAFIKSVEQSIEETARLLGRSTLAKSQERILARRKTFLEHDSVEMKNTIGPFMISFVKEIAKSGKANKGKESQ
ncbi:MAG: hypothetical protein R2682_10385 [Pyrinomonadaceae bacterium]